MTKVQRQRTADTVEGAAQAFIAAAKGLPDPPEHAPLRSGDRRFWEAIVSLRARDEWTEAQLVVAVQLARTQADIATWMREMEALEPVVYTGPYATPRVNPLISAIEMASRRQLAMMRALGLAANEDIETSRRKSKTLKAAREANARASRDPLLA